MREPTIKEFSEPIAAVEEVVPQASIELPATLLPRIRELLTRIPSDEERIRFERFFKAAAVSIESLGELDVSHLNALSDLDDLGDHDDLWQHLPPALTETLERLESLFAVVREEFPALEPDDDEDIDIAFEEDDPSLKDVNASRADALERISTVLQAFTLNLSHELRTLERLLQSPADGEERWNQLEQLVEFRGRARSGIGEMVFLMAREFAVVRKEDVVPFYKEDVDTSLRQRQAITQLQAHIDLHRERLQRVRSEGAAALHGSLSGFLAELERFARSPAYGNLRVIDRRAFFAVRTQLTDLLAQQDPSDSDIDRTVDGLQRFLESMSLMNRRELLIVHDREATHEVHRQLDALADAVTHNDEGAARVALERALTRACPLWGRDARIDGLLVMAGRLNSEECSYDELVLVGRLLRTVV